MKNKLRAMGVMGATQMPSMTAGPTSGQKLNMYNEKEVKGEVVVENPSVQQALEALNSQVKKKSNLGEEGYDIARDQGKVKPAKD